VKVKFLWYSTNNLPGFRMGKKKKHYFHHLLASIPHFNYFTNNKLKKYLRKINSWHVDRWGNTITLQNFDGGHS
jgi:hypothetical protein